MDEQAGTSGRIPREHGRPEPTDRLAARLRAGRPDIGAVLARTVGSRLAALAYAVLQNRSAAEAAAAAAIADSIRRARSPGWPASDDQLRLALNGSALRHAVEAYHATTEVDVLAPIAGGNQLLRLGARQRAVVAGLLEGGLDPAALATDLGTSERAVAQAHRGALAVAGSDGALGGWLARQRPSVALEVSEQAVLEALAAPPRHRRRPRWPLVAAPAGGLLAVMVVVAGWPSPTPQPAALPDPSLPAALDPSAISRPLALDELEGTLPADETLTLADCDIQPGTTELAYRGWLILRDLSEIADPVRAANPVYALVTRDTAEWVGWQTRQGRPMFPRPVGRLACAVDPVSATATVFAVPDSWEAPDLVQGCPASPLDRFAGYREIGGPGAFVLLPGLGTSWWADDPSVQILARVAPSPASGSEVTASARPLGPGDPIQIKVEDRPVPAGRAPSMTHYVWLDEVRFPTAGCWLVSLAVDGEEVGSAVLPVTSRVPARSG
ncbi:MAG: hypothetical protein ACRDHD_00700 [Candidatus Limnocylindria bacterium]